MRIWHWTLIEALPKQQLVAQWRELSAIASNIKTKGYPNHILVDKIVGHSFDHFISYAHYVRTEMTKRGYKTMDRVWQNIISVANGDYNILSKEELFPNWHNHRYLAQCYYNLEEKYDCGGISQEEFYKIVDVMERENWIGEDI